MSTTEAHPESSIELSDATDLDESTDRATLVSAVTELAEAVTELAEENRDLREQVSELEDTTDDLEDRADDADEHRVNLAKDLADTQGRVTDVEGGIEDGQPHASTDEDAAPDTSVTPETALEEVTALPEHLADDALSANQRRARFVARDVAEYTKSVPAGRALSAGDLSTVLRAGTDCRGHSQTVDRVIRLLDDLGGEGITVVERHGERRVVFTKNCARRLTRLAESHSGDSTTEVAV